MKKKFLGIFVCMLLLMATVLQVTGTEIGYKVLDEKQNIVSDDIYPIGERGDDSISEIGIHWINDFSFAWFFENLKLCDVDAEGLLDKLVSKGWTKGYNWNNSLAWEVDCKRSGLGGNEENIIDKVDLAYFCTHGWLGKDKTYNKFLYSIILNKPDDYRVTPGDAQYSWGNNDLEWVAFATCKTLIDKSYWADAFDGLHLLLGCTTVFEDCEFGPYWGNFMIDNDGVGTGDIARKIVQAWFAGFDLLQPSGRQARVIAEEYNNFDDYLHGQGGVSGDPNHDSVYEYWDHTASNIKSLGTKSSFSEMMLYKVVDRDVNETYVKSLGECFHLEGEVYEGENFYSMVSDDGRILQVDREIGFYTYHDLNNLWNASFIPENLTSANESAFIAITFLEDFDLLPEDAEFYDVISEGPNTVDYIIDETGNLHETVIEERIMDRQVLFARYLTYGTETFSVMGPGAKMKVYVGDYNKIIGVNGGWREVVPEEEIEIMTAEEAWGLFEEYGSKVSLITTPPYDHVEIEQTSLGYFEKSFAETQNYLIPIYIFEVDFYSENETSSGYIYIPASERFIPPVAKITSPEDGSTFLPDDIIELTGEAHFGTSPYTYSWSSSSDGDLGEGSSIQISDLSFDHRNISSNHSITLTVADSEGLIGKDVINIGILPLSIEIQGGFGVTAKIKNIGLTSINNLAWDINTDATIMILGEEKSGIIDILPGEEIIISSDLILGLGPGEITVTVDDCKPISKNAFVILFFVLGIT